MSAVDVRFQRYGVSTGRCDGGLSYLYLSDSNHNNTIRCEDKTILGNYDTMFNSSESKITIQLHLDGDPQFVWIAVFSMSVIHLYYLFIYYPFYYYCHILLFIISFVIYYTFTMSVDISSSRLWIYQISISVRGVYGESGTYAHVYVLIICIT